MRATSLEFLAEACGGRLLGNTQQKVLDVKIDSRQASLGDLFVCVIGEFNDGHDYAEDALEGGCTMFLMSRQDVAESMVAEHGEAAVILAEDTVKAFEDMASAYLGQFDVRRAAVTGSVGKTTTKMLTAAVLGEKYNTICTKKNLNTNLGLCLTCFLADESTQAVVFEMGMDARNQISEYVRFIRPEVAIITNVGVSHMERLGSRDAIADAKLEIVEQFTPANTLVVNAKSDYLKTEEEIRTRAVNKTGFAIELVSAPEEIVNKGLDGVEFVYEGQNYFLPIPGEHNVTDAVLAITAGRCLGVDAASAAEGLAKVESTERRLKVEQIGNITLLDDSYNASPDSMKAGLAALASAKGKRKIAVLSDMYELGDAEEEGHLEVGRVAGEKNINLLIAVGENSSLYSAGVSASGSKVCNVIELESKESAGELVLQILREGDVVLVKGSNGTKISEVAEKIRNEYE